MLVAFDGMQVKNGSVCGGKLLKDPQDLIMCYSRNDCIHILQLARLFNILVVLELQVFSGPVDGRVNHNSPHPWPERPGSIKFSDVLKNFHESIVHSFHGIFPVIRIQNADIHRIAIKSLIKLFLKSSFSFLTPFYDAQ